MVRHQTLEDYGVEPGTGGEMKNRNVLIVEDNRLICWALEKLSSAHDLFVTSVYNGEEAVSAVSRIPFRMAFLNMHRPDAGGLKLLHEIKRISPETEVTVITDDSAGIVREKAMLGGAVHFMEKPFSVSEVRKILSSTFDMPLERIGD